MFINEIILLLFAGCSLIMAGISWSRRPTGGAIILSLLFFFIGCTGFCCAMDLGSSSQAGTVLW